MCSPRYNRAEWKIVCAAHSIEELHFKNSTVTSLISRDSTSVEVVPLKTAVILEMDMSKPGQKNLNYMHDYMGKCVFYLI